LDALKNRAAALHGRDFLSIADLDANELRAVIELALELKRGDRVLRPLDGKYIAMLFQKPSHRTRVSFEVGIGRLGGKPITLGDQDVQLGAREDIGDAARVLDRYVDGIVARMRRHDEMLELADAAGVPVINALTEVSHPCQILADLVTIRERFGDLDGRRVAYIGDGNNIANSLIEAAALLGIHLVVITPPRRHPPEPVLDAARARATDGFHVELSTDPRAIKDAAVVYTDVWTSMGFEAERELRQQEFAAYQVNESLLEVAPEAFFMHCLPAHRGEEVTDEVIDGGRSIVFDQAENRLYAQMALLALIFG
jgi:ornithine carbamoyltransferase